jgi:hypothetical protein
MPGVNLDSLLEETGAAEIKTSGGAFNVVYRAWWETQFTDEEWDSFRGMNGRDYLLRVLPKWLVSWDLVEVDGTAVPITAEAMDKHKVPTRLLKLIETAVVDSAAAGKGNASSSPAG